MHLYDQLRQLQVMPRAFDTWASYRNEVTDYLLEQTKSENRIAVLGVGRSNDIDLKKLVQANKQLLLVDRDRQGIQAALKQYKIEGATIVKIQVADFVGISDEAYKHYADCLIQEIRRGGVHTDLEDFSAYAYECIQNLVDTCFSEPLKIQVQGYDYAVLIGIHSQLVSMIDWIWQIMLQTLQKEEHSIRAYIEKVNMQVIRRLHDHVLKQVNKGLVIGCELERVGQTGAIAGAYQAYVDLQERVMSGELIREGDKEMIWPFNPEQDKVYRMQFYTYYKQ